MIQGYGVEPLRSRLQPAAAIGVGILGILISEGFLFYDHVSLALLGHIGTIVYCTIGIRLIGGDQDVLMAILLIPIFRLVNLASPVITSATLLWLPLVYGPFIPGLFWYIRSNPSHSIGWIGRPVTFLTYLPVALGVSVVAAPIEYDIIQPDALIPLWVPQNVFVLAVVMFGFVALVEELVFRGILQGALVDRFGVVAGIALTSLLFGAAHAGYGSPTELGFAVLIGVLLGSIYHRSNSILLVIVAHGLLNVFVFGLFPTLGAFVGPG